MDHVHAGISSSGAQQVKQSETTAADDMVQATMDDAGCGGRGRSSGAGSAIASSSRDEEEDDSEEQYAAPVPVPPLLPEQYASPLSADDMVALAISLLAHPHWGPRLREAVGRCGDYFWEKTIMVQVESEARRACPHLATACARGLALALVPLGCGDRASGGIWYPVLLPYARDLSGVYITVDWDEVDGAGQEAVAAFYAVLSLPPT